MESPLSLSIVIVSYNTKALTLACLDTVFRELGNRTAEVWVVDNCSQDETVRAIKENFKDVKCIENQENLGFGKANNQAMALAKGDFFLLLNSDALLKEGTIDKLISSIQSDPKIGVVGPKIFFPDGTLQVSCFSFPFPLKAWFESLGLMRFFPNLSFAKDYRNWDHSSRREVDFVIGACLLVRRKAYQEAGPFDERYFLYSEETDWQLRMKQEGWKILFDPIAEVTHIAGASLSMLSFKEAFFFSQDQYYEKHFGLLGLISMRIASGMGAFFRSCYWASITPLLKGKLKEQAQTKMRFNFHLFKRQFTLYTGKKA